MPLDHRVTLFLEAAFEAGFEGIADVTGAANPGPKVEQLFRAP